MQEPKQGQYLNLHQILIKVIAREIFYNFGQEFFYWRSNVQKCVLLDIYNYSSYHSKICHNQKDKTKN